MRCHTTSSRQDSSSCVHASNILWTCLIPHQDNTLSLCMPFFSIVSSEHHLPYCGSRGCRQTNGNHLVLVSRWILKLWVEKLIKMLWLYHFDCRTNVNKPLSDHIDGYFYRTFTSTFSASTLQHPQPIVLDSELNIHHILVMFL
ncbi:hypothetical protein V8G54_016055 [Vigna mungo]|uniref:Uncharacterized protein n=1 Tax=Vigna mungo TaxID=3915 RepID=A0AAQ3NKF9_VIGMU